MKTINIKLSTGSINKAIRQLSNYCDNTLPKKIDKFVSALVDIGINTASMNVSGEYADAIAFTKEVEDGKALLIMSDKYQIERGWVYKNDIKIVDVSPSYMAEFGSGWYADVPWDVMVGTVGQGTFPEQKHAFNPNGWDYVDADDLKKKHSYGEKPTSPLFFAWVQMENDIKRVALEVFGKR